MLKCEDELREASSIAHTHLAEESAAVSTLGLKVSAQENVKETKIGVGKSSDKMYVVI